MSAEDYYFFKHAIVRDAAYALQLPSERSARHAHAADVLEAELSPDELESHLLELAEHAGFAAETDPTYDTRRLDYLVRATKWAGEAYRYAELEVAATGVIEHPASTSQQKAEARNSLATGYRIQGRFDEAETVLSDGLGAAHGFGPGIKAKLLSALGAVELRKRELDSALEYMGQAVTCAEKAGDGTILVRAIANLALIQFEAGEAASRDTLARAGEIAKASGDAKVNALVLSHTGRMLHHAADFAAAEKAYREAIDASRIVGDRAGEAVALSNLAELLRVTDAPGVGEAMTDALKLAREVGDRHLEMNTVGNYGLFLMNSDDFETAEHVLEQSIRIASELGDVHGVVSGLDNLTVLYINTRSFDRADATSLRAIETVSDERDVAMIRRTRGVMFAHMGRPVDAAAELSTAQRVAREYGNDLDRHYVEEALNELVSGGLIDANAVEEFPRES